MARLAEVNARHPWNHNEHFHPWVVRRVPHGARLALDVGCGAGALLGVLRGRVEAVHGIDADAGMVAAARARLAGDPRVTVRRTAFDAVGSPQDVLRAEALPDPEALPGPEALRPGDPRPDVPRPGVPGAGGPTDAGTEPQAYDVVTMVAVLHHLDLEDALARARDLLAPGGRLLVVGLARVASPRDVAVDVVSAVLNPLVGMVKHPRRARPGDTGADAPGMPVRAPGRSVDEIVRAARELLPGARVRRRLFFRYTLEWTSPGRR